MLRVLLLLAYSANCLGASTDGKSAPAINLGKLVYKNDIAARQIAGQTLAPDRLWVEQEDAYRQALNDGLAEAVVPRNELHTIRERRTGRLFWAWDRFGVRTICRVDTRLLEDADDLCDLNHFNIAFKSRVDQLVRSFPETVIDFGGPVQRLEPCGHMFCLNCIKGHIRACKKDECPTCRGVFTGHVETQVTLKAGVETLDCAICFEPLQATKVARSEEAVAAPATKRPRTGSLED